ncbi:hypothetical protein [Chromobacterium alticapitis]|uniref:Uncharacterized protein n=1 Tax=Chromobacterium alticapitis TaxID=2073169 RepID=A0A2S5DHP1_9NEIS|nr:hypothetical protein [Chromobacterium alticapitis]POZ62537.1 hypothetical protein C2I19_07635 [Chromobacterium alticapitis]
MKPFFNLGCALVAWNELCRVSLARGRPEGEAPLPFQQGRDSRQFLCGDAPARFTAYRALLLEPIWLLDQNADGRWQLTATAMGNSLNLRLQALLRAWLPELPLAQEAGPGAMRLRLALRSYLGDVGAPPPFLRPHRPDDDRSPLRRGIAPYLEQVASVVQLSDAGDGRLLGGGVNLQGVRLPREPAPAEAWHSLLACDWQCLLQTGENALATG